MKRAVAIAVALAVLAGLGFFVWPEEGAPPPEGAARRASDPVDRRPVRTAASAPEHAGGTLEEAVEPPSPPRRVRGRVLDEKGPVPGATVTAWGQLARSDDLEEATACTCKNGCAQQYFQCGCSDDVRDAEELLSERGLEQRLVTTHTDAEGRFEAQLPEGAGEPTWFATSPRGTGFAEEDDEEAGVELRLSPGAGRGTVVDEQQRPLPGVLVLASAGRRTFEASSDANGAFAFPELSSLEDVHLVAMLPGLLPGGTWGGGRPRPVLRRSRALVIEVRREGRTVPGAEVQLADADDLGDCPTTGVTGADGRLSFAGVDGKPLDVYASDGERLGKTRAVPEASPNVIELAPAAFVFGRVTGDDGRPLPPATEDDDQPRVVLGSLAQRGEFERSVAADANGDYRIGPVPAGTVRIYAEAGERQTKRVARTLRPGTETRVDFLLAEPIRLRGLVRTPDGAPVPEARVTAVRVNPPATRPAHGSGGEGNSSAGVDETGEDGTFAIELEEGGDFVFEVKGHRLRAPERAVTAPAAGLELIVDPAGGLEGVVRGMDGGPLARAQLKVASRVRGEGLPELSALSESDPRGAFRFHGMKSGEYLVQASPEDPRHGALVRRTLTVREGQVTSVELRLGPGLPLAGMVVDRDGHPLANVRLNAEGQDQPFLFVDRRDAVTDASGRFELSHLEEGEYELDAYLEGYVPASEESPRFPAGTRNVRVVLNPAGVVRGRVLDAEGKPVPAFEVNGDAVVAPDGSFLVHADTPQGEWVTIEAGGHARWSRFVELAPGGEAVIEARLERGVSLSGRVLDSRGAPAPRARVSLVLEPCHRGQEIDERCARGSVAESFETDDEGAFMIPNAPLRGALVVFGRGLRSRVVPLAGETVLEIRLEPQGPRHP